MKYRIEVDSLGKVRVPSKAFYGAQTQRAVDNFPISGLKPWPAFIWSMVVIKRAAANVNGELGLMTKQKARAISRAAGEVMKGAWNDQFVVDPFQAGAGTSHNMNINEVIANRATQLLGGNLGEYLVHPNDHVNMSQSTNDTIPTSIRLGALWKVDGLLNAVGLLAKTLAKKSKDFDGILKSGRTHLQDAVPIRLGQEFSGYAKAVEKDLIRIKKSSEGLRALGIGGTATGTGLNAHPKYHKLMLKKLESLTGFDLVSAKNLFEAMQSMADIADFSASLRTLAITVTKISNDLRLLSSGPTTGLAEISLPAIQPGSSIMPGKINPVLAEMTNMSMFHIMGCDHTIALCAQAGQLELNVMMPTIAHNLFEMMHIMTNSLNTFSTNCVLGIKANKKFAESWLENNPIIVTALNPLIGYEKGAKLVKQALETNKTVRELAIEKAKEGKLKHISKKRSVKPKEIENALNNLRKLTEGGILN